MRSFAALCILGVASAVTVDVYVMSKCPDAVQCENAFFPVLKEFGEAVDVKLHAIANSASPEDCMHGEAECIGDKQQLCAQEILSRCDFLSTVMCMDQTFTNIPNNLKDCAQEVGFDFEKVNECATTEQGKELFSTSVLATAQKGIRVSCTVNIDEKPFCVHNGGWEQCPSCDSYGADKAACLHDTLCKAVAEGDRPKSCSE